MPNIFVVDVDASILESLRQLIRREGWQPKTFESAQEFLAQPLAVVPSCLILDISLPTTNCLELQKHLAAARPNLPIIVISDCNDVRTTVEAMKAGAVEFLVKPLGSQVLLSAIRQSLELSRTLLNQEEKLRELRARYATLSPRERQVMKLVVAGLLNKTIGEELGISEITVKAHRGQVMRKMKAKSLPDLVMMATSLGRSGSEETDNGIPPSLARATRVDSSLWSTKELVPQHLD